MARGSLAAPITHEWYPRATRSFVTRYLQLHSLIALSPRGLDIVVNVDRGATTDSVAIFTVERGNLRRRLIRERGSEHVFQHGGSVAHQHGLDCKRPRSRLLLVVGGGWQGGWQRGFWRVERRVYRASQAGPLRLATAARYRVHDQAAAARRFRELGTAFRSCTVAKRS